LYVENFTTNRKRIQGMRTSNPRNLWRDTKWLTGQTSRRHELTSLVNSEAEGDFQRLANIINDSLQHASDDLSPLSNSSVYDSDIVPVEYGIHPVEVFHKLSKINIRKYPGPDGIPNWFLRDYAFAISEPISHIFNAFIKHGIFPECWKAANVVPIPKQRPVKSIQYDLRPISLIPP
jgi:hypothetical protein